MGTRQNSYTFDSRSASMIVAVTGDPIVTVGLVEVMDTMKSSSPSAILSTMVAIVTVIVPSTRVPEVNVTVDGNGSLKSEVAIDKCRKVSEINFPSHICENKDCNNCSYNIEITQCHAKLVPYFFIVDGDQQSKDRSI